MAHDSSSSDRIAVLIDADNVSHTHAGAILEELASYGTTTIKRAYADFSSSQVSGWRRVQLARAISGIHVPAFSKGKNASDSRLIIDAMDLLYEGNVEAFAIVSSDSDFTSLVQRLRESGKTVYGLGRRRTAQSLQAAVDKFIYLEVLSAPDETDVTEAPTGGEEAEGAEPDGDDEAPPRVNLQSALTKAVNATSRDDGWSTLSAVGQHLNRAHAAFDPRDFDHAKLSNLVAAQGYLETETVDGRMLVRLKSRKPTKKAEAKTPAKTPAKATAKKTPAKKATKQAAAKKPADEPGAPKVTVTTRTRSRSR